MRFWILLCLFPFGTKGQLDSRIFPFPLNQQDSSNFVSGFCIPIWSPVLRPEACVRCQCSFLFFQWRCFRTCDSAGTTTTTPSTPRPIPIIQITPQPDGSTDLPLSQESNEGGTISPVVANGRNKRKGAANVEYILRN